MLGYILKREEIEVMRLVKELYVGKSRRGRIKMRWSDMIKSNMKRDSVSGELQLLSTNS